MKSYVQEEEAFILFMQIIHMHEEVKLKIDIKKIYYMPDEATLLNIIQRQYFENQQFIRCGFMRCAES